MAATPELLISPTLALPIDAATGTCGILATKGAGKSNAAVVMAEELHDAGVPWVAVDPKGDWWGIRASADGKGPGLPVVVFGGRHGDVPLEPTAGHLLASLVLEQRLSCVLDVSQFTKADTVRFLLAFGEHLFRHADDEGGAPLHLFLEEAHEYLPQQVSGEVAKLVSVWQRIVKQGRFKGLGCTMISQRSASLNKDVLELIDTLVVLRTLGPRSRAAIKAWVHDQDVDDDLMASLPQLADGEAWIWSPGALKIMARVQFRQRRTFDSAATPKVGQARKPPATLADVDLAAIKDAMQATIERAKADDPKLLRQRVAELERELAAALADVPEPQVVHEEVPVLSEEARQLLEQVLVELSGVASRFGGRANALTAPEFAAGATTARAPSPTPAKVEPPARARAPQPDKILTMGLSKQAMAMLQELARRHPMALTERQWSTWAGYSHRSSQWAPSVRRLRDMRLIDQGDTSGSTWAITATGLEAAGVQPEAPLDAVGVFSMWVDRLPTHAGKVLRYVFGQRPRWVPELEISEATGYSMGSSQWQPSLRLLAKNGLAVLEEGCVQANPEVFTG